MKQFNMDPRNIGGRRALESLMHRHYKILYKMQPVIDTRPPPASMPKITHNPIDFSEVSIAFKKVNTIARSRKLSIDNSAPKTYQLSAQLSRNKAHTKSHSFNNHLNNLWHMQRRISDYGSFHERKKNQFDPLTNPPLLFKRVDSKDTKRMRSLRDETEQLKDALLHNIFENRIYKQEELEKAFEEARQTYQHLPTRYIEKTIHQVQKELDS